MPSPIELDTTRWTRVIPQGATQVVKCLNFACYHSGAQEPPEKASEGTELAANSTLTLEVNRPRWFRAKEPSSTEEPYQPSILEVRAASPESTGTGQLANEAVTEPKLGSEAVAEAKIKKESVTPAKTTIATTPAAGAEKSVTLGTSGVARKVVAVHVGDGAETTVTVKHSLETQAVSVVVQKGAETKKPGEGYLNAAGAGNFTWKAKSLSEIEVTFGTAPIAKFESFISVYA